MQRHFAIFNSDQLSKDGKRFTVSALEDGIWQVAIFGVPSNLSHDIHRPVGWAYAKGLYFNAESVFTIGHFLIATDSADSVEIKTARNSFFTHMMNTNIAPHADNFIEELGDLYKYSEEKQWFGNVWL
ncbi:hypothetical protein [Flavobacterium sp.]|uniref:hypothetical protein n=1 Tax=Flavobacterium sp. TaxID=239 RepID=UPI003A934F68